MINLKKIAVWLKGYDSYELRQRAIHHKMGLLREEIIPIDEIETWTVHPEMIFDIVELLLKNGDIRMIYDYRNDLIAILRTNIGSRER